MVLRVDEIAYQYGGNQDTECRKKLAAFLADQNKFKPIEVLWRHHVMKHGAYSDRNISKKEMVEELKRSSANYFFQGFLEGTTFNFPIPITNTNNHESYFRYFFSYVLSKTIDPSRFLKYHLAKSFSNDVSKYTLFLLHVAGDPVVNHLAPLLNEFIEHLKKNQKHSTARKKTKSEKTLSIYFVNDASARTVIKQFLFDSQGRPLGSKPTRIMEVACALKKRMDKIGSSKYSANKLAEVLHGEFGGKLGIEKETIRDYITPIKLNETVPSTQLFEKIKDIR